MTPITLPGDLPGLLTRGDETDRGLVRHVLNHGDRGPAALVVKDVRIDGCVERDLQVVDLADLRLDLRASASRAREWLAGMVGLDASGGVTFGPAADRGRWVLATTRAWHTFGPDEVPALATIDTTDPDAHLLALRACCLAVEVARG